MWPGGSWKEMTPNASYDGSLAILLENAPNWAKMAVLAIIRLGLRHTDCWVSFIFRISQSTCRTRDLPRTFSNFLRGAELRGYLYGTEAPPTSKSGNGCIKRGAIFFACIRKYPLYLDAEFDGDFNFPIRHDIILCSDQVLGIEIWRSKTGNLPVCNLNMLAPMSTVNAG